MNPVLLVPAQVEVDGPVDLALLRRGVVSLQHTGGVRAAHVHAHLAHIVRHLLPCLAGDPVPALAPPVRMFVGPVNLVATEATVAVSIL